MWPTLPSSCSWLVSRAHTLQQCDQTVRTRSFEWRVTKVHPSCGRAVPLYDSLGESAVEYTVNHSETSIIFAEASKLAFLSKAAKNVSKNVHTVVHWGSADNVKDTTASIEKEVCAINT